MIYWNLKDKVPVLFDKNNAAANRMLDKGTENIHVWRDDIKLIGQVYSVEDVDDDYLDEIGYLLNAGIRPGDSVRTKKQKIFGAIASHKKRGSWSRDAKPRIDAITGLSSYIVTAEDNDSWIQLGNTGDDSSSIDNGIFGGEAVDDGGMLLIGAGDELQQKGVVRIHLGGLVTPELLAKVQEELIDIQPAYFKVIIINAAIPAGFGLGGYGVGGYGL